MITSAADERIREVSTTDEELIVAFIDGRTLSVPLVWYPRLFHASPEQRSDWRLIGDGDGVHWPQIDEDLSAAGLLRGVSAVPAVRELSQLEGSDTQEGHRIAKGPVHVTPREGGWVVTREGSDRTSSVHRTQKEAEQRGRQVARKSRMDFFLHDRTGKIRLHVRYDPERQDDVRVGDTGAGEDDVHIEGTDASSP
jgi:Protein of unknown function (DUF2442)/Uncharacterized protein conserved in bacteria (DUF2188)